MIIKAKTLKELKHNKILQSLSSKLRDVILAYPPYTIYQFDYWQVIIVDYKESILDGQIYVTIKSTGVTCNLFLDPIIKKYDLYLCKDILPSELKPWYDD